MWRRVTFSGEEPADLIKVVVFLIPNYAIEMWGAEGPAAADTATVTVTVTGIQVRQWVSVSFQASDDVVVVVFVQGLGLPW